ncbi:MAG TPA: MBL fold metallo-hydrolase [Rhodocyclaceae bacterium]|nr:MBL fold metallo-hydrolase [Rhodocyclaceae bacterium]
MKLKHTLLAACIAATSLGAYVATAHAAAPLVKTQAPGYYRTMLGDFEITALSDGTVGLPVDTLLKGISHRNLKKALDHHHLPLPVETSVNGFLVNTGDKLVLIDTGAGALFGPTLGKLLTNLKAAGYQPEQVDEIIITHLHPDHVGGLAVNGQRVFPNAMVRAEQEDADYWLSADNLAQAPEESKGFFQGAQAMLKPYVDAGMFKPFSGDTDLLPGIRAQVTHAHTPGHSTIAVESKGQRLLIIGDLIHVAAVQFDHPKVSIGFDSDNKNAVKQRIKVFNKIAKNGDLTAAAHLSFPGLGHIRKTAIGYEWLPLNYQSAP